MSMMMMCSECRALVDTDEDPDSLYGPERDGEAVCRSCRHSDERLLSEFEQMTWDQFEEYVRDAINMNISRATLTRVDLRYETANAARTLANSLRLEGLHIPSPEGTEDHD